MGHVSRKNTITFTGGNIADIFEFCNGVSLSKGKLNIITPDGNYTLQAGDVIKRSSVGCEIVGLAKVAK